MPRPKKRRSVCQLPKTISFSPEGLSGSKEVVILTVEEYETIRLRRIFTAAEAVSAELVRCTVSEVIVDQHQVRLRLKNGQIIERSDLQ